MESNIITRALSGDSFMDFPVMDMHCHMGPVYSYYFSTANIEQMIEDADTVGIAKLCVAPHVGLTLDHKLSNRLTLDAITKFPDRVLGMIMFNPNKPDEVMSEFELYYSTEQFVGIKLHPAYHRYPLNGSAYSTIFNQVAERGGYALVHTWEDGGHCNSEKCEDILKRFPGVQFIFAHALGTRDGVKKAIGLVCKYENAYMDTSGFEFSDTSIEWIAAQIPQNKLLFGSDCPFHDIRGGISRVLFADLDDVLKKKILCDNYLEILAKANKNR